MSTGYARTHQNESRYRDPAPSAPIPSAENELNSSQNSDGHAATEPLSHRSGQREDFVKKITVRSNGPFPKEKQIVCNRYNCRTFTRLLEECCEKLGTTRSIRSLRSQSGKYPKSLDEVKGNKVYIAIEQQSRFK